MKNDVIIPASGEDRHDIAAAACVMMSGVGLSGDINIIRTQLNGPFLAYYLNNAAKNSIARLAQGVSVVHLYKSQLKELKLNLPPLPEQQKIATFLSLVDRRLAAARRRVEVLEEWKRGVMQRMIREKRGDWDFLFADKLFKNVSNKKHSGDLPVLAITQDEGAVFRDNLDRHIHSSQKSVDSYKIVEPGDFIISLRSFQGGIEYSTIKGIASPAYTILKPKLPIVNGFYRSYFKYPDFISRLDEASIGIRDGRQISYTTFSELKLPYPPLEEQARIASILTIIDTRITIAQQEVAGWGNWKRGLLQKLLV
jgi:type I restriction enzyme S subunit